ncbi:MAG: hypothetical protein LBT60_06485 [Oscillospiraceae bacterium]|nr:hypothetical protein [Oscillospiraceae bacterium]
MTVTADTLAFGDGTAWFEVDWTGRWDWRVTGDEPDWAAPPGDALALNDLSRFDWAALLGNFYQLFLGSPLYDPGF